MKPLRPRKSKFQSTPPARGATPIKAGFCLKKLISIHAPREGGDFSSYSDLFHIIISIHAPREGGDGGVLEMPEIPQISIHAPREGGDNCLSLCIIRI